MRNILLCLTLFITLCSCSDGDPIEDNIEALPIDSIYINDYLNQTCASAVELAYDKTKDIVYAVYLSSYKELGESRDMICLSVFKPKSPLSTIKHYIVVSTGDISDSKKIVRPFEPNILLLKSGEVRITFYDESLVNYYRDFSIENEEFRNIQSILIKTSKGTFVKSGVNAYINILKENSYSVSGYIYHGPIITSRFIEYGGYTWGVLTSNKTEPILFRSSDELKTLEPIGIFPYPVSFECSIEIINNKMYLLGRTVNNVSGISYCTSNDMGKTWSEPIKLNYSTDSRPQIFQYKNKLFLSYNIEGNLYSQYPRVCYGTREKVFMKLGLEDNPNNNQTILSLYSPYGFVYPYFLEIDGDLYMAYSNSQLGAEKKKGLNNVQGKDCIVWTKLSEYLLN